MDPLDRNFVPRPVSGVKNISKRIGRDGFRMAASVFVRRVADQFGSAKRDAATIAGKTALATRNETKGSKFRTTHWTQPQRTRPICSYFVLVSR